MGIACSCEVETNTNTMNTGGQQQVQQNSEKVQPKRGVSNKFFPQTGFINISRIDLEQCKRDSYEMSRILFLFFCKSGCSNCKSMSSVFDQTILENSTSLISLKIDSENATEVLYDDVDDSNQELPYIKAYKGNEFIGINYGNDEHSFRNLVNKALGRPPIPSKSEVIIEEKVVVEEKVEVEVTETRVNYNYDFYPVESTADFNDFLSRAQAELKPLIIHFYRSDRENQRVLEIYDSVSSSNKARIIVLKVSVETSMDLFIQCIGGGDPSYYTFPVFQTWVNGLKHGEVSGTETNEYQLNSLIENAIESITYSNNVKQTEEVDVKIEVMYIDYQFEGGNVFDVSTKEEFIKYTSESSEGKCFYIFFFKKNDKSSHEMFKIYCQHSVQYNKKFIFGMADVEKVDYFNFAMTDQISNYEFPVIQSYNFGDILSGICTGNDKETFEEMIKASIEASELK